MWTFADEKLAKTLTFHSITITPVEFLYTIASGKRDTR